MISYTCGEEIKRFSATEGYLIVIRAFYPYDLVKYLIPFVAVIGFCFLVMLTSMIIKCARDRRRVTRRRLSRRKLKKLPTKKYKKGEEPETCPICLDDFDDGDKLRVLPCNHIYHTKCVDPWLTKNRKVCPVCKRKVLPGSGDSSDSENEDRQANAAAGHDTGSRVPLLGDDNSSLLEVGNSIFYAQSSGSVDQGQYLTPPSSPDLDEARPGPSSVSTDSSRRSSKRGKSRVVVPGFVKNDGSHDRLVVPVPADEEQPQRTCEGVENPGYDSEESQSQFHQVFRPEITVDVTVKMPSSSSLSKPPRRKRHAATIGDVVGKIEPDQKCLLADEQLNEDSDSEDTERKGLFINHVIYGDSNNQ